MNYHRRQSNFSNAKFNLETKLYDVVEAGRIYSMPMEVLRLLNDYFGYNSNSHATVADWYRDISKDDRDKVQLTQVAVPVDKRVPPAPLPDKKYSQPPGHEFYPDATYED